MTADSSDYAGRQSMIRFEIRASRDREHVGEAVALAYLHTPKGTVAHIGLASGEVAPVQLRRHVPA